MRPNCTAITTSAAGAEMFSYTLMRTKATKAYMKKGQLTVTLAVVVAMGNI